MNYNGSSNLSMQTQKTFDILQGFPPSYFVYCYSVIEYWNMALMLLKRNQTCEILMNNSRSQGYVFCP